MGEIVAGCVLGHVPTLMVREEVRLRFGGGVDTTLWTALPQVRSLMDDSGATAWVLVDTHWFTTTEHVIGGQAAHRGTYTSEELPAVIRDLEFDYPGAPDIAAHAHAIAKERGVRTYNTTSEHVAHHYPTLNLVSLLRRDERVMSVGVCQTASADDFLAFGSVLAEAVGRSDERAIVVASGGMSHRFWPLAEMFDHQGFSPDHIRTPEARAADEWTLERWAAGDHAAVIDAHPSYLAHAPEGLFGHYLTMAGALGGRSCVAPGRQLSNYESSYGTGQVHVWFPA